MVSKFDDIDETHVEDEFYQKNVLSRLKKLKSI